MSDADRLSLAYVAESTWGETPSGPPTLQDLRFTSESLHQETRAVKSREIRADRQVVDLIRTGLNGAGGLDLELSYGAYDDFLEAALLSPNWSTQVQLVDTDIDMAVGDNSINQAAGDFTADGFVANQWIKTSGFATAANNGFFKIVSVAALKMVLKGGTVATEAAGPSVTVTMGPQIVNGTTFRSFAIEKKFTDLSSEFSIYNGMTIETLNLNIVSEAIVTGAFGFLGQRELSAAATAGDGSNTAAPTKDIMNSVDDVTSILEDFASFPSKEFNFSLANNLRARTQIATLGPISIGTGKLNLTGVLRAYYASKAIMDKYLAFTQTALAIVFKDGAGNSYVCDFPAVKFMTGQRVGGGENTDIIADMTWETRRHPTEDVMIRIARFAA